MANDFLKGDLNRRVAVVTGAASGIGLGLARRALQEGMQVVMADYAREALDTAIAELCANGASNEDILAVCTDLTAKGALEDLAEQCMQRFRRVDLLCNNAGVGGGGPCWENSEADWDWVLNINLKAVINGVRVFTPLMIEQGCGHIVNTASIAGLMSAPNTAGYTVSKHAVVALSEILYGDLRNAGHKVGVSVLCPSFVDTQIFDSDRNRPAEDLPQLSPEKEEEKAFLQSMAAEVLGAGLAPDAVADLVFKGIQSGEFWLLTHPQGSREQVAARSQCIINNELPSVPGPEAFPMN